MVSQPSMRTFYMIPEQKRKHKPRRISHTLTGLKSRIKRHESSHITMRREDAFGLSHFSCIAIYSYESREKVYEPLVNNFPWDIDAKPLQIALTFTRAWGTGISHYTSPLCLLLFQKERIKLFSQLVQSATTSLLLETNFPRAFATTNIALLSPSQSSNA